MITVFGIKQCSTMKKAFDWLENHNVQYSFHDYKKLGIERKTLEAWISNVGWERLLNTRGTTWRKLPEESKQNVDTEKAIGLMLANPSIIKRPVIVTGESLLVGFNEQHYEQNHQYWAEQQ